MPSNDPLPDWFTHWDRMTWNARIHAQREITRQIAALTQRLQALQLRYEYTDADLTTRLRQVETMNARIDQAHRIRHDLETEIDRARAILHGLTPDPKAAQHLAELTGTDEQ